MRWGRWTQGDVAMALGRREGEIQQVLFITADQLPKSIGHVFDRKLNKLIAEAGFDR